MIELLAREPLPLPDSSASFAVVCGRLEDCYRRMSARVLEFVAGLPVWAELDSGRRQRTEDMLRDLPAQALGVYEAAYRDLAADNREFAIWAGLTELRAIGSGLSGMEELLAEIARAGLATGRCRICWPATGLLWRNPCSPARRLMTRWCSRPWLRRT